MTGGTKGVAGDSAGGRSAIDIICGSRELFGSDRSALRLASLLRDDHRDVRLVLPAQRPERGLQAEARQRGIPTVEEAVAIAGSRGIEQPLASLARKSELTERCAIHNTSSVLGTARRYRRRVVVVREWFVAGSVRHRLLARWHQRRAEAIVAPSDGALDAFCAAAGAGSGEVIPNWLDENELARLTARPEHRGGVVCLGRFNQWKGQEVLAAAHRAAFGRGAGPPLTFVGAQPATPFDARARRLSSSGWAVVPFEESAMDRLTRASLLVVPSLHPEPFGMVVLEALAAGCRVLAFPGGGPADLAAPFAHALTIVDRSVEALAAALRAWADDGAPAQTELEWERTRYLLADGWSSAAALPRWQEVFNRLERRW